MLGLATARARSTGSRHRRDRPRRADLPVMQPCRMSSWRPAIAATVFHNGRSGVSTPTSYADLQDHTEAQSQITWERESQTSISGSRTLHFASSRVRPVDPSTFGKACTQMFGRKQRLEPKEWNERRPPAYDVPTAEAWQERLDAMREATPREGPVHCGVGSAFLPGA